MSQHIKTSNNKKCNAREVLLKEKCSDLREDDTNSAKSMLSDRLSKISSTVAGKTRQ